MEHIHSHHCHHDHDDDDANQPIDPAMQSLADALKVSFRVLSIGMLVFVLLFLATGISSIEPTEQGIVKVFGKVTRVVPKGLVYNWPFPIGEIQKISTKENSLDIGNRFWMFETPEEKGSPLAQRSRQNNGLRPGYDGYLITGDRNIIHIRFSCLYRVGDPLAYVSMVQDPLQSLTDVVCAAAVEAAATRTADSIQYNHESFLTQVKEIAQAKIDVLMSKPGEPSRGIIITNVLLKPGDSKTWPLGAFDAYEKAQRAESEKQIAINKAIATAKETLINSVGSLDYAELVGEPWDDAQRFSAEPAYNLIALYGHLDGVADAAATEYAKAPTPQNKAALEKAQAERRKTWDTINIILTRATIGGQASKIIAQAESEKTAIIENAQRRAKRFVELHEQYEKAPQLFLDKMWANVYDELMSSPTVEKWYFTPGKMGSVVKINSDPAVRQAIRDYRLKQEKERKAKENQ